MKTLIITAGDLPIPAELDDVIARGSTSVERRRVSDIVPSAPMPDADRVVFWSSGADLVVRQLAVRYAKAENKARKEVIVFVTDATVPTIPRLSATEVFVWPQDRDRLTMAFMTGA
jgi:hypothetical protein